MQMKKSSFILRLFFLFSLFLFSQGFKINQDDNIAQDFIFRTSEGENVRLISNSSQITDWVFNQSINCEEITFNGLSWNLYNNYDESYNDSLMEKLYSDGEVFVSEYDHDINFNGYFTTKHNTNGGNTIYGLKSFLKFPDITERFQYIGNNFSSTLHMYLLYYTYIAGTSGELGLSLANPFNADLINWDNHCEFINQTTFCSTTNYNFHDNMWITFIVNESENRPYRYFYLNDLGNIVQNFVFDKSLYTRSFLQYQIPSFYQDAESFFCQTNLNGDIRKLRCDPFSDVSMNASDFLRVQCQTSTEDVDLQLLNDGIIVKTISLLQENTIYDRQTIEIILDEDVTFDQIQFTNYMDAYDFLQTYSIKANRHSLTPTHYSLLPKETRFENMTVGNYELSIYERNILKEKKNITIDADNTFIFTPSIFMNYYINLKDLNAKNIDASLLNISVNNETIEKGVFRGRLNNTITIRINDSFYNTIYNETLMLNATSELKITADCYPLILTNNATKASNINISSENSSISFIIEPSDTRTLFLYPNNYTIKRLNGENNEETIQEISLIQEQIIVFQTIYNSVELSVNDNKGNPNQIIIGTPSQSNFPLTKKDLTILLLNGEQKDFGFNIISQDLNNIKIKDYFNTTIYNQDLNLTNLSKL